MSAIATVGAVTALLSPLRATLVAAAVLAGLFAMHGLTHHGEQLPSHDAGTPTATHAASAGTPTTTPDASGVGHGAMVLCLAILLGGLLAGAGVRRPRSGLLLRVPRDVARTPGTPAVLRTHDPPVPWSLSVCRC